jgi:predicted outer membrane repeat protein
VIIEEIKQAALREAREARPNPPTPPPPNLKQPTGLSLLFERVQALKVLTRIFFPQDQAAHVTTNSTITGIVEAGISEERKEPYKGLQPFGRDDTEYFCGRRRLTEEIVNEIIKMARQPSTQRFLCIVGASGAGKSSLVMAGVMPRLQEREKHWYCLPPTRPGENPLQALALTLHGYHTQRWNTNVIEKELADPNNARRLQYYINEIARREKSKVVLYIDQFEELFMHRSEESRGDNNGVTNFIKLLMHVARANKGEGFVIITLRADFLDYLLDNRELSNHGKIIHIPAMSREELREVIEKPAEIAGLHFESMLVSDLLNDIEGQKDVLPLLEFTLKELYDRRDHRTLTAKAYAELHGPNGALDRYAQSVYESFLNTQNDDSRKKLQDLVRYLFCSLINVSGPVEKTTRRSVAVAELALDDENENQLLQDTIKVFVDARLLVYPYQESNTTNNNAVSEVVRSTEKVLEISHEALIREWQQLRSWIEESLVDLRHEQHLYVDSLDWKKNKQSGDKKNKYSELYSGKQLRNALALARRRKLTRTQSEFVKESYAYVRKKRFTMAGIILSCLVVFGAIGFPLGYKIHINDLNANNVVTTSADSGPGSLREILTKIYADPNPHANRTITFDSSVQGPIHLTKDFEFSRDITIAGPTGGFITLQGDQQKQTHIIIDPNVKVTLANLEITGGHSYNDSQSFLTNHGNLTLDHCDIHDNSSVNNGGGVANLEGTLTLLDSTTIRNNVSGSGGGGIYSQDGVVIINNSRVYSNTSYNSGGGIYSTRGRIVFNESSLEKNNAKGGDGGGISLFDGQLIFSSSEAHSNNANTYGGAISIAGGTATLSTAHISGNIASPQYGGESIAVVKDTDNDTPGEVTFSDVGQNEDLQLGNGTENILGLVKAGSPVQITSSAKNYPEGGPAPTFIVPNLGPTYYLGVASIDAFCVANHYSYGTFSDPKLDTQNASAIKNASDVKVTCHHAENDNSVPYDARQVCQQKYPNATNVIDRVADFYDQTTLQCYRNVKPLGPVAKEEYAQRYCSSQSSSSGVEDNPRYTAYDWRCKPKTKNELPAGFSVTDVCQFIYNNRRAFDHLTNFYSPEGWECLAPIGK